MFAGVGTPRGNFVLNHQLISDGYFDAAGIPLLRGRDLTLHDNAGALQVAVINQALARIAFPGRDALGAAISTSLDGNRPRTVVVIVADAHDRGPAVVPMPTLYLSELQIPRGYGGMLVRFTAAPSVVAREIQRRIAAVDPAIPVSDVMTTGPGSTRCWPRPGSMPGSHSRLAARLCCSSRLACTRSSLIPARFGCVNSPCARR